MQMITVEKITDVREFYTLEAEWERLHRENDRHSVFYTLAWLRSWWDAFGGNLKLYVLVARDNGRLLGIAPFMITPGGLRSKKRILRFIGAPNADYSDIIGPDKSAFIGPIIKYLMDNRREWDLLELSQIDESSPTIAVFAEELKKYGAPHEIIPIEDCAQFVYKGNDAERRDFEIEVRKSLKRSMRILDESGGLELVVERDRDKILGHLPYFFSIHINRWRDTPTPSKFNDPRARQFYENLVKNLADKGCINLMALRHKNKPIAYFFTYAYEKTAYLYTLIHDLYYSKFSPGNILIAETSKQLIADGFDVIDHTRGAKAHKGMFANRESKNYRITIYKNGLQKSRAGIYKAIKNFAPVARLNQNQSFLYMKARFFDLYSRYGIGETMKRLFASLTKYIFSYKALLVFEYGGQPREEINPGPGIEVKELGADDIETIASFLGFLPDSRKESVIIERFDNGSKCFMAYCDGHAASISWGIKKRDYLPGFGRYFELAENEVLFADDYTLEVFRGKSLHPLGILHRLKYYEAQNCRILMNCLSNNEQSLRGIHKGGFVHIRTIHSMKIFSLRIL